jgi:hypothetical protein
MTEQFKKEHPALDPDKFVTLTNGFDPCDFADLPKPQLASEPVVFSYFGEFYFGRTPEPFLRALRSLIDAGKIRIDEVKVQFVGTVAFAEGRSVPDMVRSFGLERVVSVEPLIPRREALQRAMTSHVLLVLTEQHSYVLTFKLFDALAVGATILNIGCGGAVADVLSKTGRGIAVDHTDLPQIEKAILGCIRRSRSGERIAAPWSDSKIQAYNFLILTRRLSELLEKLKLPELAVHEQKD